METKDVFLAPPAGLSVKKIEEESGIPISRCYQCLKCSNGCPVTYFMDYLPHEVIRSVQLGLYGELLHSSTMWVCSTCATCATRCPNGIDVTGFMDFLKNKILSSNIQPKQQEVAAFHQAFMDEIKRHGRINEFVMMAHFSRKRGGLWKRFMDGELKEDMKLGLEMFRKGRLKPIPKKASGASEVKDMFKRRRS